MRAAVRYTGRTVAVAAALLVTAAPALAAPRLDGLFGDHALVQRDQPLTVSGDAQPGETVLVNFGGSSAQATADRRGRFEARLPAMAAGGPYTLTVAAPSGALVVDDVMVGDLFLCSGQSNMEMSVSDAQSMIAAANAPVDPGLRLVTIQKATAVAPQERFAQQPRWQLAGPDSIPGFSAACFYMAQDLRRRSGVPVGAIHSSWGGSRISAWMSDPALRTGGLGADADLIALFARDPAAARQRALATWEEWWRDRTGDRDGAEPWQPGAALDWQPVPAITNFEGWGVPALATFNGMLWFQREVQVSAAQARGPAVLSLGRIDDADQSWVNGVAVGGSSLASELRVYALPPGTLRPGTNTVTVNVDDVYANGGMLGPAEAMQLTFADGSSVRLGDGWRYAVARPVPGAAPRTPWGDINGAGTLFNAMIAPLRSTRIAGIAWYQGESDTGLPGYDRRLTALIADWRQRFGTPQTAFAVAQLSAYGTPPATPSDSGWGIVRDAQRRVAAEDAHGGLAVTHDIGDFTDIHPGEKYQVGLRLARAMTAAMAGAASRAGPAIASAFAEGDGVRLRFEGVDGALHPRSAAVAIGFELCGAEAGSCRWASGRVQGSDVFLPGDGRPVTHVRYAFGDAPSTNLSDDALLPVGTFDVPVR
nr:sialate O-acetylesterase [Sphingomonas jejuensis]